MVYLIGDYHLQLDEHCVVTKHSDNKVIYKRSTKKSALEHTLRTYTFEKDEEAIIFLKL